MTLFAEVIVPLRIAGTFTYEIPENLAGRIKPGQRVLVQFGLKKFYTAIVDSLTTRPPEGYGIKPLIMAPVAYTHVRAHET
ncbi:MAG: hypothetical protein K2G01_08290, partial [Paramuribaculum sp.]|nr:hypothetical protein [Paramuribaculum sp.]